MRGKTRLKRIKRRVLGQTANTRSARSAAPGPRREDLLKERLDLTGTGLEMGPSHRPLLPKRDGFDVRTADHMDRAGLVEHYRPHGVNVDNIEDVDYVLAGDRLTDDIHETFDYIVASHMLEHTVCLISFLQDCEALLKPGGVLTLALPDRRYCFDRFRERASIGRVIDTYHAKPTVHTPGTIAESHLNLVKKDGRNGWVPGTPGPYKHVHTIDPEGIAAVSARMEQVKAGQYLDMHNWVFTPHHFRLLISDLHLLGFTSLRELGFHDTVGMEFFATLSTKGEGPSLSRRELVALADVETTPPDIPAWS